MTRNTIRKEKPAATTDPQRHNMRCHVCGETKPASEFNFLYKQQGRHMTVCKDCEHDQKRQLREKKKAILDDLKTVGCACCGESDLVCLDFHHYDPDEKEFNMSAALTKPLDKMMIEASKCIVVCSNCHRKIHAGLIDTSTVLSRHEYEYRKRLMLYAVRELAHPAKKR